MIRSSRRDLLTLLIWLPVGALAGVAWQATFNAAGGSGFEGVVVVAGYALLILMAVALRDFIARLRRGKHAGRGAILKKASEQEAATTTRESEQEKETQAPSILIFLSYRSAPGTPRFRSQRIKRSERFTYLNIEGLLHDQDAEQLEEILTKFVEGRFLETKASQAGILAKRTPARCDR